MTATLPSPVRRIAAVTESEHRELLTRAWSFRLAKTPSVALAVRPAGVRQLSALGQLHRHCSARSLLDRYHRGGRPPTSAALEAELRSRLVFMASNAAGEAVAAATIGSDPDHGPKAAVVSLLVADDWQRRGIGSTLLTHLAGVAHVTGHTELIAYPATAVVAAQRLMIEVGRTRMIPDGRAHLHTYVRDDATLGLGAVLQRLAG